MKIFSFVVICLSAASSLATAKSVKVPRVSSNILPKTFKPPQVFQNINLLRNINLEKGYVREVINVVIENIDANPQSEYYLPFKAGLVGKVGGLEVRDKKNPEIPAFKTEIVEYDPNRLGAIQLLA